MVKLPGITEELKRRPVFDVNSLLGEAENHTEERLKTRVEVPHDPTGTGSSHFSPSRGDVNSEDSQSPKPQRTNDHESVAEDVINPTHYRRHPSGIECIEVTRHMNFNVGNAVKYLWRCDHKHASPINDLKKAQWYIDDEIRRLEGKR